MSRTPRASLHEQFWRYVSPEPNSGCWLWDGAVTAAGYGKLGRREHGRLNVLAAHRVALVLDGQEVPAGAFVCHHCDNPACVNPAHLYIGDAATNSADCVRRDRVPRGEAHYRATLTAGEVQEIRRLRADGLSYQQIAARVGKNKWTCREVAAGRCWRPRSDVLPAREALTP